MEPRVSNKKLKKIIETLTMRGEAWHPLDHATAGDLARDLLVARARIAGLEHLLFMDLPNPPEQTEPADSCATPTPGPTTQSGKRCAVSPVACSLAER